MSAPTPQQLLALGLSTALGPAIVLDAALRITCKTPDVDQLMGSVVPLGKRAPHVLCGESDRRPIADALAQGLAVSAEVLRPAGSELFAISVRTLPLRSAGQLVGHLLLLGGARKVDDGVTLQNGILTANEPMRALLRTVEKVAPSDASVLVRGETGAGKELIARALHALSPRRSKPFFAINCAALPEQLLESELFGHQRGAFTGAIRDNEGTFRRAHGGTLFLDEVAEMPLSVQAKLLRVTQDKLVLPLGGTHAVKVDVRIVSATHKSLRAEVEAGRFRADLMYRLRVVPLFLPALRQRPEDIEALSRLFIDQHNERGGRRVETLSPGAIAALLQHDWPGNVRELQNVIEYAFLLGQGPIITEADLPPELGEGPAPAGVAAAAVPSLQMSPQARRIARALERAAGNRKRAADSLGISRSTLWRRMKQYQLTELENEAKKTDASESE